MAATTSGSGVSKGSPSARFAPELASMLCSSTSDSRAALLCCPAMSEGVVKSASHFFRWTKSARVPPSVPVNLAVLIGIRVKDSDVCGYSP